MILSSFCESINLKLRRYCQMKITYNLRVSAGSSPALLTPLNKLTGSDVEIVSKTLQELLHQGFVLGVYLVVVRRVLRRPVKH